jgi:uncharacterized membrane protein YhaH (DUF805 family)
VTRYVAAFWICIGLAAWCLYGFGHGLEVVANNPHKYVNAVMITSLVVLAGLAALFIWLALRFRRRRPQLASLS